MGICEYKNDLLFKIRAFHSQYRKLIALAYSFQVFVNT